MLMHVLKKAKAASFVLLTFTKLATFFLFFFFFKVWVFLILVGMRAEEARFGMIYGSRSG